MPAHLSHTAILNASVLFIVAASNAVAPGADHRERAKGDFGADLARLDLGPATPRLIGSLFQLVIGLFIELLPGISEGCAP